MSNTASFYSPQTAARKQSANAGGAPLKALRHGGLPRLPEEKGNGTYALVQNAIERLEIVVDEETAALRSMASVDLKEFNNRKSQGLLELTRALRAFDGGEVEQVLRPQLESLRTKLETNQSVLKMHLEAVQEISTVMATAIRDIESDGTYSQTFRSHGSAR